MCTNKIYFVVCGPPKGKTHSEFVTAKPSPAQPNYSRNHINKFKIKFRWRLFCFAEGKKVFFQDTFHLVFGWCREEKKLLGSFFPTGVTFGVFIFNIALYGFGFQLFGRKVFSVAKEKLEGSKWGVTADFVECFLQRSRKNWMNCKICKC